MTLEVDGEQGEGSAAVDELHGGGRMDRGDKRRSRRRTKEEETASTAAPTTMMATTSGDDEDGRELEREHTGGRESAHVERGREGSVRWRTNENRTKKKKEQRRNKEEEEEGMGRSGLGLDPTRTNSGPIQFDWALAQFLWILGPIPSTLVI
jgi:hypothetical protein